MVFLIIFLIIVLIIGLIVQSLPYILIFAGLTITGTLVYRHIINQKKEAQEAEKKRLEAEEKARNSVVKYRLLSNDVASTIFIIA